MKQYRITLFFVALIFCELPILGQIILSYDSVTICQGSSKGLQPAKNKGVIVPIKNQLVTLYDTTIKMASVEENADVTTTGTLLFKEDFGGNALSDPSISTVPVSSMDPSYHQKLTAQLGAMSASSYLVTKIGYANGDTSSTAGDPRSQWYIQDDHTYPNDYDRGYFLEIDASSGKVQTFYTATLNDLCAGSTLTFSAYVSNVYTWFQNNWYEKNRGPVMDPNLSFIIYNTANNQELARYETGDIVPDTTLKLKSDWAKSATWHLCGFSFVLPNEVSSVQLSIVNNTVGSIGNDFALDDIEIRLCTPPVIVLAEDTVCVGASTVLTGMFTNDGTFTEPLEYRWLYSATGDLTSQDSWTTIGTNANTLAISSTQLSQSGYYRLAVSSTGGIDLENCRAMSNPVHMFVNQCSHVVTSINDTIVALACDSTAIIKFLSNDTYTCATPKISLLTKPTVLGAIATIQSDSLVYRIVSGHAAIDSVQYSITCDGVSASAWAYFVVQSNSLITTEVFPNDTICKGEYLLLSGKLTNGGMLELPVMYQWQESSNGMQWTSIDSLGWTSFGSGAGSATVMFPASVGGTTYYRVVIAELGDDSLDYCFVTSSIIPIQVIQPSVDTLQLSGCGLVEYEGQTFLSDSIFVIEMQNPGGCSDELTVDITVKPEPLGETTITDCDSVTYLGVTYFQDTDLTEKFSTDSECDSVFVTHIDVDDCMSGYLVENLIVNKYDWIILCNNTKAKKLLPNYDEINYQWYKDGQKMVGELDDYYTEDRLLFGCFFLRLLIMSDGQAHSFVSETLCVNHEALTISPNPVTLSQYAIINYDFTEEEKVELSVEIYNYLGTKITRFKPTVYPTYLPGGLAQGIYYVKVITGIGRIFGVKLIVN